MTTGQILKSPLLHFFAIGGLIFLVFSFVNDDLPVPEPDQITLTLQEAKRLSEQFASTWSRQPTNQELEALLQNWAREEASVREALSLGLDRGDSVIRQRLKLKMDFIAESGAAALAPDETDLQSYLEANPERFRRPARMSFEQILTELPADSEEISAIRTALQDGADPSAFGNASLLLGSIPMTPAPAIDRMFGTGFHEALSQLPKGSWEGPVESGYGMHFVRVIDSSDAVMPPLADIKESVEAEWRAAKTEEMKKVFGQALLDRYTVSLPSPTEVLKR